MKQQHTSYSFQFSSKFTEIESQIKSNWEINYFSLKLQKCDHFCNRAAGHHLKKDHEMGILVRFSWTWKKEEDKRPVFWPFFQSHVLRGHSLATLTKFWLFLNRLPELGWHLQKSAYCWHFQYHLPTSFFQRSLWMPPYFTFFSLSLACFKILREVSYLVCLNINS